MTKLEAIITIKVFLSKMEMLGQNMQDFVEKLEKPNAMAMTVKELAECEAIENIDELAKGMKESLESLGKSVSQMVAASEHCGQSENIWRHTAIIERLHQKAEQTFMRPW